VTAVIVTGAVAYPLGVASGLLGVRLRRAIRREDRRQQDILSWFERERRRDDRRRG
jgi:hypothetical protein